MLCSVELLKKEHDSLFMYSGIAAFITLFHNIRMIGIVIFSGSYTMYLVNISEIYFLFSVVVW